MGIPAIGENYFEGGKPMASNYTENFGLCQWEATDQVLRTEFNEDNTKIEAALVKHDAALSENMQAIRAEADNRAEAINSLSNVLTGKGNCKIEVKSYSGTGNYGSGNLTTVTFSNTPQVVIFYCSSTGNLVTVVRGCSRAQMVDAMCLPLSVSWSGSTVRLSSSDAKSQMNENGYTYFAVALVELNQ